MHLGHIVPEFFADYFNGKLTADQEAAVEEHIAGCEPCAVKANEVRTWDTFMAGHLLNE